jgi:uncharacterized protein (TIGR02996 family)
MTPEQPHLDAISCDPDADFPKLVYADWLEERGRIPEAEAWRWIVTNGKRPEWNRYYHWRWWLNHNHNSNDPACIGLELSFSGFGNGHATQLAAYLALVAALVELPHIRCVRCVE